MSFSKRLRAYILGIALGFIVVYLIFRDRSTLFTSWLPKNRILAEISSSRLIITPASSCILDCIGIAPDSAKRELFTDARIDFGRSETKKPERTYRIVQQISGDETVMMVTISDSTSTISSISSAKTAACPCPK